MIENFTAPENVVFAITFSIFLLIGLVQLASFLMGLETFSFLDDLIPDVGLDVDGEGLAADLSPTVLDSILSMLKIGRVPLIFTIVLFLFLFSFFGYNMQQILHSAGIGRLPALIAAPVAFVITLPFLRLGNGILAKTLPRDETAAISSATFIGRIAVITLGKATHKRQTEAKLVGPDGKTYYIQVVADVAGAEFSRGDHVLVVGKRGEGIFTAIQNTNPLLEDNSL